jgi:hypothetical protein
VVENPGKHLFASIARRVIKVNYIKRDESLETPSEFGDKNNEAYDYGSNRGDEYCACGDIFRVFGVWMIFGRGEVDIEFERSVKAFSNEHHPDRENDEQPFGCRYVKIKSKIYGRKRYKKMNPGIVCGLQKYFDAMYGVLQTLCAFYNTERFFFRFVVHASIIYRALSKSGNGLNRKYQRGF